MAAGDVVGIHHVTVDLHVGNPVGAAAVIGSADEHAGLECPISATVKHDTDLVSHDPSVLGHPGLEGHHRRVTRVACHQFLNVVHNHFDGPSGVERQVITHRHIHERPLAAKIATNAGRIHPNLLLGHVPYGSQLIPQHERTFVVGPHLRPAIVVDMHHTGVRLHVALVHQLRVEGVLKDQVCRPKALFEVTLRPRIVSKDVIHG